MQQQAQRTQTTQQRAAITSEHAGAQGHGQSSSPRRLDLLGSSFALFAVGGRPGVELGTQLGIRLGVELGIRLGVELGIRLGVELGIRPGAELGIRLGVELAIRTCSPTCCPLPPHSTNSHSTNAHSTNPV
ncbi:uncharacterized protein BJ171DRAFT_425792 [Polychytrium aggregatum]|uniref:uncharacterized protein n=1 Tax=Polychytrium aggregatum TaxID=110093 RepID=UPI0022FF43BA|nr:uncharacterized protein BJ171DRAFT_425792 [Polychytrium aggregatum]KAI9203032.1 hypothetical protein BJ171DRAFT_425792 [Polychytrium aggregatum]